MSAHPIPVETFGNIALETFKDIERIVVGKRRLLDMPLNGAVRGGVIGSIFETLFVERFFESLPLTERILWRPGDPITEYDVVYIPNQDYSFEIKTASTDNINTSRRADGVDVKPKRGYYLLVRYEPEADPGDILRWVRFGWIDDTNWSRPDVKGRKRRLRLNTVVKQMQMLHPPENENE